MQELARLYPDKKVFDNANKERFSMFDKVSGTDQMRKLFQVNNSVSDIQHYWDKDIQSYYQLSKKYYLYH